MKYESMEIPYTASRWPIVAAMLPFARTGADGIDIQDAGPERWHDAFRQVADAGFDGADLTDSWVRPGDLSDARLTELSESSAAAGIRLPAISAIRRSVIDSEHWRENLAYSHRTLDAAAHLGCEVVSVGLHQALTEAQVDQLWFWTVEGHKDPVGDVDVWNAAVERLQELGRHAEELGLLLSLELYEDTYLGTGESAVRLVEDIGLPNVGLNPDIGNLIRLHRPVESWRDLLQKTLPYANYWHVKNYARDEDAARAAYFTVPSSMETGLINYREAIEIAISAGFQGIICTEHYGGDGLSVCASNQSYLRDHVLPKRPGYALGTPKVAQGRQHRTRATAEKALADTE